MVAIGMVGSIAGVLLGAKRQRCAARFYRDVLAKVPKSKRPQAAAIPKAIHTMEPREASSAKVEAVADDLEPMQLKEAAKTVREEYVETLAYREIPNERWRRTRMNNTVEHLNGKIGGRIQVVDMFPDERSALMPAAAHQKHVASSEQGSRRHPDVSLLEDQPC